MTDKASSGKNPSRNNFLWPVAGIGLGAIGATLGAIYGPDAFNLPAVAQAQFERFEQRNSCGEVRVAYHAALALRGYVPRRVDNQTTALVIRDGDPAIETRLNLVRDPEAGTARYVYSDLFGKSEHAEQWRPDCTRDACRFHLNYYVNELAPGGDPQRAIDVAFESADGEVLETISFETALIPRPEERQAQDFPPLTAGLSGDVLRWEVRPENQDEMDAIIQIRDAQGYREIEMDFEERSGPQRFEETLTPPVSYAGVLVAQRDPLTGAFAESKVELANDEDAFYMCEPGR